MKIGLLAYSTQTGLGYQTKAFYDHIKPDKVLVADLSKYNKMPTFHNWYENARISDGFPSNQDCEWLVDDMDIIFLCENPLNYYLYEYANSKGVKTVQQFNPEFLEYFRNFRLPKPTILANPSTWMLDKITNLQFTKTIYLPVPLDNKFIPKNLKKINKVKTLIHICGRPAANDRNGTIDFLTAACVLGTKYKYRVYIQKSEENKNLIYYQELKSYIDEAQRILKTNLEIIHNCKDNSELYRDGDILILPRRYGGLCLPLWEALGSGIPVIMTNVSPNYSNLPSRWLCEAKIKGTFFTQSEIVIYESDIMDLCEKIENVAKNISHESKIAYQLAINMSWENQKQNYINLFEEICK